MKAEDYSKLHAERVRETFQMDPQVKITLKGKEWTLEFNNYGVKEVLKETGLNLLDSGFGPDQWKDPKVMGALFYQGLKANYPDLTQEEADKLFSYRHYSAILSSIRTALSLFMPDMSDVTLDKDEDDKKGESATVDPTKQQATAG